MNGDDLVLRLMDFQDHWPAKEICQEAARRIVALEHKVSEVESDLRDLAIHHNMSCGCGQLR